MAFHHLFRAASTNRRATQRISVAFAGKKPAYAILFVLRLNPG